MQNLLRGRDARSVRLLAPWGRASGSYTIRRDGGLEYQYDATWDRASETVTWSARERRQGESFSLIDGQISLGPGAIDLEAAVHHLVERSIEQRIGVD